MEKMIGFKRHGEKTQHFLQQFGQATNAAVAAHSQAKQLHMDQ